MKKTIILILIGLTSLWACSNTQVPNISPNDIESIVVISSQSVSPNSAGKIAYVLTKEYIRQDAYLTGTDSSTIQYKNGVPVIAPENTNEIQSPNSKWDTITKSQEVSNFLKTQKTKSGKEQMAGGVSYEIIITTTKGVVKTEGQNISDKESIKLIDYVMANAS